MSALAAAEERPWLWGVGVVASLQGVVESCLTAGLGYTAFLAAEACQVQAPQLKGAWG